MLDTPRRSTISARVDRTSRAARWRLPYSTPFRQGREIRESPPRCRGRAPRPHPPASRSNCAPVAEALGTSSVVSVRRQCAGETDGRAGIGEGRKEGRARRRRRRRRDRACSACNPPAVFGQSPVESGTRLTLANVFGQCRHCISAPGYVKLFVELSPLSSAAAESEGEREERGV